MRVPRSLAAVTTNARFCSLHEDDRGLCFGTVAVGDELLAIDGWRIGSDNDARALLAAAGVGATVEVALFRRGRLVQLRAEVGAGPPPRFELQTRVDAPPAVAARYPRWLGEPYPPGETLASITIATRAV